MTLAAINLALIGFWFIAEIGAIAADYLADLNDIN